MKINNCHISQSILTMDYFKYRLWQTYLHSSNSGMWFSTIGSGLKQYDKFIAISSNFMAQPPAGTSRLYTSTSSDGKNFFIYQNHDLNLYDPNAHGAVYNSQSTVRPVAMATNTNANSLVRYIITFASAGGTTEDEQNGRVPSMGVQFYLWSSDGNSWNKNSMPLGNWRKIYNFNGTWVAISYIPSIGGGASPDTKYCVSTDGLNWSLRNFPIAYRLADIAFDGFTYVVTGISSEKKFLSSTDLLSWNIRSIPVPAEILSFGSGVQWGDGYFIAPQNGESKFVLRSQDGANWQLQSTGYINLDTFISIRYHRRRFLILTSPGNNIIGRTYWSENQGQTWNTLNNQPSTFYNSVVYDNTLIGLGFNNNYSAGLDLS